MSVGYSPDVDRALELAARAHRHQTRKGGDLPYIAHPVHVAMILLKYGLPEPVVIAGVLHDVVEDTEVSLDDVRAQFGDAVAELVAGVTETKQDANQAERSWRTRKEEQLAHLAKATREGAALKAADALHNAETTLRDVTAQGPDVWKRFRAPPAEQVWWYRSIATLVTSKLGDHPLARELHETVERLVAAASGGKA